MAIPNLNQVSPNAVSQMTQGQLYGEQLTQLTKAAGDSLRLDILRVLASDSFAVLELCSILDIKQSALSHHLKLLLQCGLVQTRREANSIFYRRYAFDENPVISQYKQALFAAVDEIVLAGEVVGRLEGIHAQRAESSLAFFRDNSEAFQAKQDLIAKHEQYEELVMNLLEQYEPASVLEVGPGEGYLLPLLAKRFKKVIALDNSAEMLERSKSFCAGQEETAVQFIHADTKAAVKKNIHADAIVINMVLHHVPRPAALFNDFARLLNNTGILVVTELCLHDQDWVKEACGDVWQGFDAKELQQWATDSGFSCEQSEYLALRNGFQIQFHVFKNN